VSSTPDLPVLPPPNTPYPKFFPLPIKKLMLKTNAQKPKVKKNNGC
jgi:hypothetical protein